MRTIAGTLPLLALIPGLSTAATSTQQVAVPATKLPNTVVIDAVPVTINLTIDVKALNPLATTTGATCLAWVFSERQFLYVGSDVSILPTQLKSAAVGGRQQQDTQWNSVIQHLNAYSDRKTYEPQYYGSNATAKLPLTGGEYHGTATLSLTLVHDELVDTSGTTLTKPYAVILCRLKINGADAYYAKDKALPTAYNVSDVDSTSVVLRTFSVPIPGMQ